MRSSFADWKKQSGEELIRSISPVPDEEGEFQDKFGQKKKSVLHLETELQEIQGGCLLYMKAQTAQTEPKFEQQRQIDAREGICARIELSENPAILAIYQHKYWWTRPAFPKTMGEIPPKSQLLLLKYEQRYVCVLAVCSEVYRGDLEGSGNGLLVRLTSNQNGRTGADALAAVLTFGTDPYECIRRAGKEAAKALGHPEMLRENKKYPEVFNWFGWCIWSRTRQRSMPWFRRRTLQYLESRENILSAGRWSFWPETKRRSACVFWKRATLFSLQDGM